MTDSPVVGSASFELRVDKKKAKEDIQGFERDLKGSLGQMETQTNSTAGAMGGAFGRVGEFARAGIGAVVAVAALAVAGMVNLSFGAIKMGDDIAKSARNIGIGTDALQEFRYVAQKTGADAKDADQALDSFATKFAQASAGTSKEASKAFGFLGLGQDDLKKFGSVEAALDNVIDRIKDLKSESSRVAVAEALGLGPLSNALRDSAVDIANLRDEARSLGIVMDAELVRRASDAQGQFDTLSQVIDVQLKQAFIDLAPVILAAIGLVADLATALANAMDNFRTLENRTTRGLRDQRQALINEQAMLRVQYGDPTQANGRRQPNPLVVGAAGSAAGPGAQLSSMGAGQEVRTRYLENEARIAQLNGLIGQRDRAQTPTLTDRNSGGDLIIPPGRDRAAAVDRSAEREERRRERVEQEIFRAKQRLLDVSEGDLLTAGERWDLARDQLKMEREARDAEIESKNARGEIKDAELARLRLANEQADFVEDEILKDNSLRDIWAEELANAKAMADLTADLLSIQASGARTAEERRRIELELLEIAQRQRRAALDQELNNNPSLTDTQRQEMWDRQKQIDTAERDAVTRRTMGPLDQWRDQSLKTAGEVSEAFEAIAARGLDSLNDGIVDAIMNSKSLGETFSQVAKQILADLLAISVRRGITEPLANALFGAGAGGGTGGGGGLGGLFGAAMGGLGNMFTGGFKGFSLPNIASGITGAAGGAASALGRLIVEPSKYFDVRVAEVAAPISQSSASSAYSGARAQVPADMATTSRYTRGRRP